MDIDRLKKLSGLRENDEDLISLVKEMINDMGLGYASNFDYTVDDADYAPQINADMMKLIELIRNKGNIDG